MSGGAGLNIAQYRKVLDPLVKPESFRRNWSVLAHVLVHFAFVTGSSVWIAKHIQIVPWWGLLLAALVCGHSIVCLGFAGHELDHDVPVRHRLANYVWESVAWVYSGVI